MIEEEIRINDRNLDSVLESLSEQLADLNNFFVKKAAGLLEAYSASRSENVAHALDLIRDLEHYLEHWVYACRYPESEWSVFKEQPAKNSEN